MTTPMDLTTFSLPVSTSGNELAPEMGYKGMRYNGDTIPYTEIEKFACTDNEMVVTFHEVEIDGTRTRREPLILQMEEESVHQVHNSLSQIIYKNMRQQGIAQYADDDKDKSIIINAPIVDTSKISKKNRGW